MTDPARRFFEAERLRAAGDLARAEFEYRALLDTMPRHVGGLTGLAAIHDAVGQAGAAAACRVRIDAIRAEGTANVGARLLYRGDVKKARQCCTQALALDPDCLKAHWLLGDICARADDSEAALAHYRRCREIAPERLGPGFMMAALGEGETPAQAPADFVTAQFDWYADSFDDHLVNMLLYRGPEEVAKALRPELGSEKPAFLDLGCGTGLLGPEVRSFAGRLIGVDLSPAMLEKAAARGLYDALVTGDLVEFLVQQPAASADIAAAVDVVVYIGDIALLCAAVARVLRPGGIFAFTTERWDTDDPKDPPGERGWHLRPNGRYRHARAYVRTLAAQNGFDVEAMEDRVLRYELGLPVDSDLILLRKRAC